MVITPNLNLVANSPYSKFASYPIRTNSFGTRGDVNTFCVKKRPTVKNGPIRPLVKQDNSSQTQLKKSVVDSSYCHFTESEES